MLGDGTVVTLSTGGTLDLNGRTESVGRLLINGSTMSQTNGALTTTLFGDFGFSVGFTASTTGTYNMSGGTLTLNGGGTFNATYGTGSFNQTGGAVTTGSWTVFGRYGGSAAPTTSVREV